jgi:hypothetical protein
MTSRDDLRIGDAERDVAMTALREHYAQGRLTHEELDERLEMTLSARTGRDLALAGADLPDLYDSRPEDPEGSSDHRERWEPGWARRRGGGWGHGHGPHWHAHHGRDPHQDAPHPAAWHHRRTARRGGPPPFVPLLILLILLLVIGGAGVGFGALKFIFLIWLAVAVLSKLQRRRWHSRAVGRTRRAGRQGPF